MAKYGTYDTWDVPCSDLSIESHKEQDVLQKEAFKFLEEEFEKIGGSVRVKYNNHDFGPYPSFEIDYPFELENVEDDGDEYSEEEKQRDEWIEKADIIRDKYNLKFQAYL